jgi:D-alanine-D-alanine ligase
MRLAPNGDVYVIEANPNPWLASRQEFAMAAKASGLSYTETIGTIIDLAMARYLNAGLSNGAAQH